MLDQLALLRSYQLPALGRWKEGILSTVLFQVQVFVPLLACFGAWRAVRSRDRSFFVPAWFVLFLLVTRAERIRYLLPLFPLLALMAAYGLRTLFAHGESRRFAAYSALAASIVLVLAAYRPFLEQTTMANLRDAGAYLDTLPGDTVRVQVLPQRASSGNTEMALPVLDLFTRKRLVYERRPLHRPDEQVISRSPLRFTWEQRLPVSYEGPAGAVPTPRVVIADEALPDAVRSFAADTGTFRYRTAVSVLP